MNKFLAKLSAVDVGTGLKNLMSLLRINYKQEIRDSQNELLLVQHKLRLLKHELLYFKVLDFFSRNPSVDYVREWDYLKKIGSIALFPYRQNRQIEPIVCGIDAASKMPYVLHRGKKKLFFPASWNQATAREAYVSLVEESGILGGSYMEKAPHQYQTETFCVRETDIVLDIGAAEGLFALEVVEKVGKVLVFECDDTWLAPLRATFEPYKDKVVIINKFVADVDSPTEIRLDTCLKTESYKSLFLKLDIEGSETRVLGDPNNAWLTESADIRIACCTYHKQQDAIYLKNLLGGLGYQTEFSDGYMIYVHDENIQPPYFRHGVIRAWRNGQAGNGN